MNANHKKNKKSEDLETRMKNLKRKIYQSKTRTKKTKNSNNKENRLKNSKLEKFKFLSYNNESFQLN